MPIPLSSPWLAVGLGVLSAVTIVRAAPRFSGGFRLRVAAGVLVGLSFASYANAFFAYVPTAEGLTGASDWPTADRLVPATAAVSAARRRPRGAVVTLSVPGTHSGVATRSALVYLPPQYFSQPSRRFPVLYLLHGSPGVPLDWFRGGQAADAGYRAAAGGRPVVLVAPQMSRRWLDDSECVDTPRFHAEQYLLRDVVPRVDASLRTLTRPAQRGLSGNSAGGYCALDLALRHPGVFGTAAAMSALTRPTYSYGSTAQLFGHPPDLAGVVSAHSPEQLLAASPDARRVRLRFDVGRQDPVRRQDERLARLAAAVDVTPPLLVEREGGHTYRVWRPALRDIVAWFGDVAGRPG